MAAVSFRLKNKMLLPGSAKFNVNTVNVSSNTSDSTSGTYWLTEGKVKKLHHDPNQVVNDRFSKMLLKTAGELGRNALELIAELGGRKTNANEYPLPTLMIDEGFSKFVWEFVKENPILPHNALKAHALGDIYWHKLPAGFILPYCNGNDITEVLEKGLWTPVVYSRPPKHFISAVDQTKEFIMNMQAHWTGAQGTDNLQLHWAPFAEADKIDYTLMKQIIQSFIFTINMPMRVGGQAPFSNWAVTGIEGKIILDEKQPVLPGGKRGKPGDYWGYLDTSKKIMKAMLEVLLEGDGYGRTFTFPVSTIYMRAWGDNFKWLQEDAELWELFWTLEAKRGTFYFLNTRIVDPNAVLAMCCRMTQNKAETVMADAKSVNRGGVFSLPSKVGSLNIASINLPRIALESGLDKEKAMEMLEEMTERLIDWLVTHRRIIEAMYYSDMMAMVRHYFTFQEYINYFSTVGVVGLPDFALLLHPEYDWTVWGTPETPIDFGAVRKLTQTMVEALKRMRAVVERKKEEYGVSLNLEQVPAETAASKLFMEDWTHSEEWRKELRRILPPDETGEYEVVPMYSNFNTPSWHKAPADYSMEAIWQILWVESKTQPLYTGGVMKHIYVAEEWDYEQLAKFVQQVLALGDSDNEGVVYFSWSPPSWACENGHQGVGFYETCPICGAPAHVRVRIVGWNTDPNRFSPARFIEMKNRGWLNASGAISRFFWEFKRN